MTTSSSQSRLTVLSGPSGVGKGTLVALLRERHPELWLSVSATTRAPRTGEEEGVHYFFHSQESFQELVAAGGLLEWASFAGNSYGTPRQPVSATGSGIHIAQPHPPAAARGSLAGRSWL